MPEPTVEISDEQYRMPLDGQAQGKELSSVNTDFAPYNAMQTSIGI